MSVTDIERPVPAPVPSPRNVTRRRTAFGLTVVILASCIAALAFTHFGGSATPRPRNTFLPYVGVSSVESRWVVGRTLYEGGDIQPRIKSGHLVVNIRSVTPLIVRNTARATVTVISCTHKPGGDYLNGGGESVNLSNECAPSRTWRPSTIDLGQPADSILFAITLHRPGSVRIDGADVRYLQAGHQLSEHAGTGIIVQTSRLTEAQRTGPLH